LIPGGEVPVALNVSKVYAQITSLKQQSAAASHIARLFYAYKSELVQAWSGIEVEYLLMAIDAEIHACEKLSNESDALCRDIVQAVEDILSEEASVKNDILSD